jgi:alpha-D-ribose 1-methylphosphonate 5-triphosphate diphosphatase PhnM
VPSETPIFGAMRIVTMSLPLASHVAVRDGRILAVRDPVGPATVDDRFAGNVMVPRFVEVHGQASDGLMWRIEYLFEGALARRA